MSTQIQTLQELCLKNPALRNLLQFDACNSEVVAELLSETIRFRIFYSTTDENFLLNYTPIKSENSEDADQEGYVRCIKFEEVLEAINEELADSMQSRGLHLTLKHTALETLWMETAVVQIKSSFRPRFAAAMKQILDQHPDLKLSSKHLSRWMMLLNNMALSA